MFLNKQEWLDKIKGFVQSWFSEDPNAKNILSGIAACLSQEQEILDTHLKETFIDTGSDEYVALHGEERSVERYSQEALSSYRERVKAIVNQSNLPAIKRLVDALLIRGECSIVEHTEAAKSFFNREVFFNRGAIDYDVLYNAFTVFIDPQIPEPETFFNREAFFNREYLNGSSQQLEYILENIIKAINTNKAFGTVYRLYTRTTA
jgi:hypothetical protein